MPLTGRKRFRTEKRFLRSSKLVLQVEYTYEFFNAYYGNYETITDWRDARTEDLTTEET